MKLITRIIKTFLIITIALVACQSAPKTDLERINALKEQVQSDAKTMDKLALVAQVALTRKEVSTA